MLTAEYDYATDIAVQREEEREIALQQGIQKGRLEGMQQGRQEGRLEGMEQGKEERNADIVLKMFSKGLDLETISEYTELTVEEIKKIKERLQ